MTSLLIGATGALALAAPASAQSADIPPDPEISVEGIAECWPYGEGGAYQWDIWWFVSNLDEDRSGVLEKVVLTAEPASAADAVEMYGLFEGAELDADGELHGKIELPHDTPVTGLSIEVTVEWPNGEFPFTDTRSASVELTPPCEEPEHDRELPELGEWTFDCERLAIVFTNPFREQLTFSFQSSTGEVVERTLDMNETDTIELTSSADLEVDILVYGEPIATSIVISSQEWAEQECDQNDGGGGELPLTGTSTALIAGGAVVLLALGGGMFMLARRRRISFSA